MMYRFHCDLSYDGSPPGNSKGRHCQPATYVFAGFFATEKIWDSIDRGWTEINRVYGVPRFHAAHLNGKTNEYKGWDDVRKKEYSAALLKILSSQGKELSAISCGIFADDYRDVISDEGRRKMGSPYIACFNSCITRVARAMDANNFPREDKFSALIDEDDECLVAVDRFNKIKNDPRFTHRGRMGVCVSANMEAIVSLQPADLIAYEIFKWMMDVRKNPSLKSDPKRFPLKHLLTNNSISEGYWNKATFARMKTEIESTPAKDSSLVIVPQN